MNTISTIIDLVIYLAEMAIAVYYSKRFLIAKRDKAAQCMVWVVGYMILYGVSFFNIAWLNIICFFIVNLSIIVFLYESGLVSGVFHSMILTAVMALSESVMIAAYSFATTEFRDTGQYSVEAVIAAVMSKIIYFFVVCLLRFLFKGKKENSSEGYKLFFIPIVTIGLYFLFISICRRYSLSEMDQIAISVGSISLLLINMLLFWEREKIIEKGIQNSELNLQIQKEKDIADYYRLMLKRDEELKIIIHDYKKHLQAIEILCRTERTQEIEKYIESILGKIDTFAKRFSDDKLIDAILTHYAELSKERGISFSADVRQGVMEGVTNEDTTALLSNTVENAYEAAALYKGEDPFIDIRINRSIRLNEIMLVAVNSCNSDPRDSRGEMYTTKGHKGIHGMGIKSIKRILKKYDGEMTMYFSNQEKAFHLIIKLCNKADFG